MSARGHRPGTSDLGPCGQHRLFLRRSHAGDAPAVEHEVERCTGDSERKGKSDRPPDPMARVAEGYACQHGHHGVMLHGALAQQTVGDAGIGFKIIAQTVKFKPSQLLSSLLQPAMENNATRKWLK